MNQPRALKFLFLTEMWERYGFYTAQVSLVLYMIGHFHFSDAQAYSILGQFSGLVYLMPVLGGLLADRFLGCRFAILIGGLLLSIGYALLAVGQSTFYWGLVCIIAGNGLLKPNISTLLGQFYENFDSRREAGFTLFYVGINLGSMFATLSVGYIRQYVGWVACFAAASFAMLLGLAIFRAGYRSYEEKGFPPFDSVRSVWALFKKHWHALGYLAASLFGIYFALTSDMVSSYGIYLFGVCFYSYAIKVSWKHGKAARARMFALLALFSVATIFWALYYQMYFSINVFTQRVLDKTIFGHDLPTSVFLGLEPIFILFLGPIMALVWRSGKLRLSTPLRFALSVGFLAFAMQALSWVVAYKADLGSVPSAAWLIMFFFFVASGELLVSPIGLAMVTEYSPKEYTSLMMGGWFMCSGFGGKIAGVLAQMASVPKGIHGIPELQAIYHHAFQTYAWLGFGCFIICLAFVPLIRKYLTSPTVV